MGVYYRHEIEIEGVQSFCARRSESATFDTLRTHLLSRYKPNPPRPKVISRAFFFLDLSVGLLGLDRVRLVMSNLPNGSELCIDTLDHHGVWKTRYTLTKPSKELVRVDGFGNVSYYPCIESLTWLMGHLSRRFPVATIYFELPAFDRECLVQESRMDLQQAVKEAANVANHKGFAAFPSALQRRGFAADPVCIFMQPGVALSHPRQTASFVVEIDGVCFYAIVVNGVVFTGVGLKEAE